MRRSCSRALSWVAELTAFDRVAPRAVVCLSMQTSAHDAHQDTSMSDRELDRVLELLAHTGHVGGVREPAGGFVRWRRLRLLPAGLREVGAWPAESQRHRLPTGCSVWDGRDAPMLGHLADAGPFAQVACRPTGVPGSREAPMFAALPITRVDAYWSLHALRDAELIGGRDDGAAGWQEVHVTAAGRALARRLAGEEAPGAGSGPGLADGQMSRERFAVRDEPGDEVSDPLWPGAGAGRAAQGGELERFGVHRGDV
jgi:hypothetical protein